MWEYTAGATIIVVLNLLIIIDYSAVMRSMKILEDSRPLLRMVRRE